MYRALAADPLPDGFAIDDSVFDQPIGVSELGDRLLALRRGQTDAFFRHRGEDLELVTLTATAPPPTLGQILPMLQCLDLEVLDRRSCALIRADGLQCHVVVLSLVGLHRKSAAGGPQTRHERMDDTLRAMLRGDADVDDFHKLVVYTAMTWRDAAVFRAYARYLRQLGQPFSAPFAAATLVDHTPIATALLTLFHCQVVGPTPSTSPRISVEAVRREILDAIQQVPQLDADRLLRALLTIISATVRTNSGEASVPSAGRPLALKIAPQQIPFAPAPRPMFEIYVQSPDIEGVHLRFGRVARGGLRWSNRTEDLRTEVLGLATTQQAKNAVIVPYGAKGGYVLRRATVDGVTGVAAGKRGYELFVSALLDVTDNVEQLADNNFRPDEHSAHMSPDAYLVVAADKGTATFADSANDIALARRYWLGDAFASGGRVGYDHKKMGITARGAWVSALRHLSEMGIDPEESTFTVAGIGDMSGDVFGNGMLLSPHIRLVAAFDHRDIFIDPDPDPATTYAERYRLFATAGSGWKDYDTSLLSSGGGVWSRNVKSIELSEQLRAALGVTEGPATMTPDELIRAILRAPVNMIWNGGIGTYVKASTENHLSVGDKSTDTVRIDADELRAHSFVEGGNLGLTQAARIEYARGGGRINTDALDNSAGVDCSDHEVNIKIALSLLCLTGHFDPTERDAFLRDLEADVADMVLANNFDHNVTLGVSRRTAAELNDVHARQIKTLDGLGDIDRHIAGLPSDEEFSAMTRAGRGLLSPDLAILMAHTKLSLKRDLVAEEALDDPEFDTYFTNYFPERLRSLMKDHGHAHPLRRDIVATTLVNHLVASAGLSFVHRLREQTGANTLESVRGFRFVTEVFGVDELRRRLDSAGLNVELADEVRLRIRLLIDRCAALLVSRRRLASGTEVKRLRATLHEIKVVVGREIEQSDYEPGDVLCDCLTSQGTAVTNDIAEWLRWARIGPEMLDAADIAATSGQSATDIATVFYDVHRRLRISELLDAVHRVKMTGPQSHFLARLALSSELSQMPRTVTESLFNAGAALDVVRGGAFETAHELRLNEIDQTCTLIIESTDPDIESLVVLLHRMKNLAGAATV